MFIHIDIDSFFASAERTVNPKLNGIPIAVGGRSNLEIFNKNRTNIKLMNDNYGTFVTPVFYYEKEKIFELFFVDTINGQRKIRGIVTTSSYEARAFGVKTDMPIAQALQLCSPLVVIPYKYKCYYDISKRLNLYMEKRYLRLNSFLLMSFFEIYMVGLVSMIVMPLHWLSNRIY